VYSQCKIDVVGAREVDEYGIPFSKFLGIKVNIRAFAHAPGSTARVGDASSLRQIDFGKRLMPLRDPLEGGHGVFPSQQ